MAALKSHYQKIKDFYHRYEKFFMPALIIWGFVYHYITFKIIPVHEVLYLVSGYLFLATVAIVFAHLFDSGRISQKLKYVRLFSPLVLQFSLGSIIGGVSIFYWFSGSIFVSWPFLLLIIILVISIEAFKDYLENPLVQFGLYNFSAILLLGVALPYSFRSLSPWLFIAAGSASFILVLILVQLLGHFSEIIRKQKIKVLGVSLLTFVVMALFYYYNIIPPVPLSIREAGVYHDVKHSGSEYLLQGEQENFWERLGISTPTIHLGPGERAYVFSAIFTPTDLNTNIVDDWQHYDETAKNWVSVSKISFAVVGGRQDGYRGYTLKSNLADGLWRVFIETPRGQVLGRFEFNIEKVAVPPALVQTIK